MPKTGQNKGSVNTEHFLIDGYVTATISIHAGGFAGDRSAFRPPEFPTLLMNKEVTPQASVPLEELRRIVKLMKDNDLSLFQFEKEGFRVKLRRGAEPLPFAPMAYAPSAPASAPAANAPAAAVVPAAPAKPEGTEVTSPMVGTFYLSPSPGAEPFVKVGDPITEGQTLCIIEAMKVMNEINAEKSGVLSAIVAQDGTAVQFGAVLFIVK